MSIEMNAAATSHAAANTGLPKVVVQQAVVTEQEGVVTSALAQAAQLSVNEQAAQKMRASVDALNDPELVSMETVKAAAVAGNTLLRDANRNLHFQVDDETKQVVVKIVDSETGEMIRQIPTVEMLDFIRRMKELEGSLGMFVQDKV